MLELRDSEFNLWAKDYDMDVKKSERENRYPFAAYKEVLDTVYSKVSGYEKKIILDLGFGTGVLTKRLYDDGHKIYGLDFSEEMLKISKSKMPEAILKQFDFSKGLPEEFSNIIFDYIISTYAIHHLTDEQKIKLITEILRNLKDDGAIIFGDVAFENTEEMLKAKEKDKDIWDDEEHYIISDKIAKLLPYLKVNFEKLSYCSGVLTIRKSD
ncbi:MAG: class I SAM-dependent methyltransferase [Thermoanaerobacter sp.]|nr:class I SAM-dependent methyltransferase [Thermoanaerobacter sp.]